MFSAEQGAMAVINSSVDLYERHFLRKFPLYEYVNLTKEKGYDFSINGALRLKKLIDKAVADNLPVPVPDDYENRVY